MSESRSYQSEFPDFGQLDVELPSGFSDVSWHHDAMPSFQKKLPNNDTVLLLIDYQDVAKRENSGFDRFIGLLYSSAHGEQLRKRFSTNDWAAMVRWAVDQDGVAAA